MSVRKSRRSSTVREQLRVRLRIAEALASSPAQEAMLAAALEDLLRLPRGKLVRCAHCGRRGLPERIAIHDCPAIIPIGSP
jgi:hypothetical protein